MRELAQSWGVARLADKGLAGLLADLVKARLTCLVLLTTLAGFYLGATAGLSLEAAVQLLAGTGLVASGAAALNQWLEREHDARMRRTADRPLPSRRMEPRSVLALGVASSIAGLVYLALAVNPPTAALGGITLLVYLFVYTPLKRVTWLNTWMGAVPGALPPLMGWTAARGDLEGPGWILCAILALWQVPHFLAIAWMYREDYARAGFAMLPVFDASGRRTARHALVFALALLLVSGLPWVYGLAGLWYLGTAILLGGGFVWQAIQFCPTRSVARARRLFYASILYLPFLLISMVLDKCR
jgi:protoheme IX farnesyltransferase